MKIQALLQYSLKFALRFWTLALVSWIHSTPLQSIYLRLIECYVPTTLRNYITDENNQRKTIYTDYSHVYYYKTYSVLVHPIPETISLRTGYKL
jgi:hypothetical protein